MSQRRERRAAGDHSHLPTLGPRGEGWFALQVLLIGAIAAAGAFSGAQWTGIARVATVVAGVALLVAGFLLGFVAVRTLDRSLSPLPRPPETAQLIQHGVYGRLRHPIYAAVILLGFGWALLTASWLALALSVALAALLDLKARREEVWLLERFPDYADYAQRTRRFIPGIY